MGALALVAAGFGCRANDGDPEAFCALATQLGDQTLPDADVTREELDRLALVYQELDETAPGPVSDDVELLDDAVQKLREGDVSFIADEEQARELAEAFDALSDYVRQECP